MTNNEIISTDALILWYYAGSKQLLNDNKKKAKWNQINILGAIYVTANDYPGATYSYVNDKATMVPELTQDALSSSQHQQTTVGNREPAWRYRVCDYIVTAQLILNTSWCMT